jgi:K+-transporting ATPase KdpF subunit
MSLTTAFILIVTVSLMFYLVATLLYAEKF